MVATTECESAFIGVSTVLPSGEENTTFNATD